MRNKNKSKNTFPLTPCFVLDSTSLLASMVLQGLQGESLLQHLGHLLPFLHWPWGLQGFFLYSFLHPSCVTVFPCCLTNTFSQALPATLTGWALASGGSGLHWVGLGLSDMGRTVVVTPYTQGSIFHFISFSLKYNLKITFWNMYSVLRDTFCSDCCSTR